MQARLTAYLPDNAAPACTVPERGEARIGRDAAGDLVLDHPSISRRHASLRADGAGQWWLHDLGSKNGSFVDGARVASGGACALPRAAWLRLGDVYCEFALLDDQQAAADAARQRVRQTRAAALTAGIARAAGFDELLDGSLRAVVELAHCTRGFLLLGQDGEYRVRAQLDNDAAATPVATFPGSVGAVERALATGRPVVVNEVGGEAWLAGRASVVAGGLGALACLPLRDGAGGAGAVDLGVVYADRRGPGEPITVLDLELLQAFAERTAVYIAARRASDLLAGGGARWAGGIAVPHAPR